MTQTVATAHDSDSRRRADVAEPTAIDDDDLLLSLEEQNLDALLESEELSPEDSIAAHPQISDVLRRRLNLIAAMHRSAPVAFDCSPVAPRQESRASVDDLNSEGESASKLGSLERSASLSRSDRATFGDRASDEYPRTIGRFEIVEVAGRGAFRAVLKARDSKLGRLVAIKIPHAGFLRTAEERERFMREAQAVASLQHPHVVAVHEIGEERGLPFIVTDYVEGSTLAESVAQSQPSARAAAELVAKVAGALATAHAEQIVDRDIKPGNILLDLAGEPHVTDFGLARVGSESSTITSDGQLLGTPAYMSPEQAGGLVDQLDARSTVWESCCTNC